MVRGQRVPSFVAVVVLMAIPAVGGACSVCAKQTILSEALDDRDDRKEYFEAILRELDGKPEYVDEFFAAARDHEPTLDRFIMNAAQHLDEEKLAELTAAHLVANPQSLRRILVASMRAAEPEPRARAAISGAILDEIELATAIMTDDPEVVRQALIETVRHVSKKREARTAFVQAMYGTTPTIAAILAHNPKVLSRMFEELTGQLGDHPDEVEALLKRLASGR